MIRWLAAALWLGVASAPAWCQGGLSATRAPAAVDARNQQVGPRWESLSLAHQSALAPLKAHWAGIDADRKAKWIVVAQRFPAMPAEDRRRVQARMAEWAALAPSDRGRARQNFQELRNLAVGDRQALWEAYRALPEEQRLALAKRARAPSPAADAASTAEGKRRVAVNPPLAPLKPVSPTVVQAKPGATTTLVTRRPAPPVHHQPGMPKITASKDFVNPSTLLPSRGPQGAAALPASAPAIGLD